MTGVGGVCVTLASVCVHACVIIFASVHMRLLKLSARVIIAGV